MTDLETTESAAAPILLFVIGNPSRGDDALGPLLLERLSDAASPTVEILTDFQLQIEHSLDLHGRRLALFIDASVDQSNPLRLIRLQPARDRSFTSHALPPAVLLKLYLEIHDAPPPTSFQLAIAGYGFDLGSPLTEQAESNLGLAERLVRELLRHPDQDYWLSRCNQPRNEN